jgi:hypothetical protein
MPDEDVSFLNARGTGGVNAEAKIDVLFEFTTSFSGEANR